MCYFTILEADFDFSILDRKSNLGNEKKSDPPPHKRKSVPRPVPVPASNSPNLESQPLIPEAQPVLVESEPKPDERVTSPSSSGPSQPLSPARGPTRRPSTPSNSLPERGRYELKKINQYFCP